MRITKSKVSRLHGKCEANESVDWLKSFTGLQSVMEDSYELLVQLNQ